MSNSSLDFTTHSGRDYYARVAFAPSTNTIVFDVVSHDDDDSVFSNVSISDAERIRDLLNDALEDAYAAMEVKRTEGLAAATQRPEPGHIWNVRRVVTREKVNVDSVVSDEWNAYEGGVKSIQAAHEGVIINWMPGRYRLVNWGNVYYTEG